MSTVERRRTSRASQPTRPADSSFDLILKPPLLPMLDEVGSDEVKPALVEGVAPRVVAVMELRHRFLDTFIIFEFKDVDVLSGEYLKVATPAVAVVLGDGTGP